MIKIVSCGYYFDLVLHMKNVSLEIFYGGVSGCLSLICEITRMRERLKRSCTDFMSIDNDSIIFACFDCLKDQIFITVQKRFVASLLKMECFNSKMKTHTHIVSTPHLSIVLTPCLLTLWLCMKFVMGVWFNVANVSCLKIFIGYS